MNLVLRVLNLLVMLVISLGVFTLYREAQATSDAPVAVAVGAGLWLLVPLFAYFALGRNAARGVRTTAVVLNVLAIIGLAIACIVLAVQKDGPFAMVLAFVLVMSPLMLNVWRIAALRRAAAGDDAERADLDAVYVRPRETAAQGNYLVRHWRGDLSLPVSYWVNGVLVSFILLGLFLAAAALVKDSTLRSVAIVSSSALLLMLIATVWSSVGIWRAAADYKWRGESPVWATAAQVMTVLGFLSVAATMPQLKEFFLIATGNDPMGRVEARVLGNGTALLLRGTFGEGSTAIVRRALAEAPDVRTLVLESRGGRMGEARGVAELARRRNLDTYVESFCASACTYVFLAGNDRAATPNAKIGFHRPSFAGVDSSSEQYMAQAMLEVYRKAGISESFLERVAATSSRSMWFPTRDELIENGVINRVSMGGEIATAGAVSYKSRAELAAAFRRVPEIVAIDRRFPGTLDRALAAAWEKLQSGASDNEVTSAARVIVAENFPRLLGIASVEQLETYTDLMLDQLNAARKVSREACGLLMQSRLDISKVLPPELATRERQWITDVLAAPPQTAEPLTQAAAQAAIQRAFQYTPPAAVEVISNFESHADDPVRQCEAMLEFYNGVMHMPEEPRRNTLRALFQQPT